MKRGIKIAFLVAVILLAINLIIFFSFVRVESKPTTMASSYGTISLEILADQMELNLTEGWNFVSFFVEPNNYSITGMLTSIDGSYDYIQEWNSSEQDFSVWSKYGQQDFIAFDRNKSYFIYMNQNDTLLLDGRYLGNLTIDIVSGWESPDYIYEYYSNVTGDTFYNATFTYMQKWNSSDQEFLVYSSLQSDNPFDRVEAAEGYLLRTEGGRIVYYRQ